MQRVGDYYEYIATYVDDLAICSKDPQAIIDKLKKEYKYKLKGTGPLSYHLGCDYFRDDDEKNWKSFIKRFHGVPSWTHLNGAPALVQGRIIY